MNSLLVLVMIAAVTFSESTPSASLDLMPSGGKFQDAADNYRTKTSDPRGRTLDPFFMFSSTPTLCRYDDDWTGTCMKESECTAAGGRSTKSGECRGRACCLLQRTCGEEIQHQNTYFVNPDFPQDATRPQLCYLIVRVNTGAPKACALRLEFETFQIHDPTYDHTGSYKTCRIDNFQHTGAMYEDVPYHAPYYVGEKICGNRNGSHLGIPTTQREYPFSPYNRLMNRVDLRFILGDWEGPRKWKIKVSYFACTLSANGLTYFL